MNTIIGLLGLIILIVLIVLYIIKRFTFYDNEVKFKPYAIGIVCAVALIIFSQSFTIIQTNYSGVKTTFGQVDEHTLSNGFNWKIPFVQDIELVNNKQQDIKFDDTIEGETSRRTELDFSKVTVTYSINKSSSAWLYANVTDVEDLFDSDLIGSAIKASSKKLDDEDASNRGIIEPKTKESIQKSLDEKFSEAGTSVIKVNKVVISEISFKESYNKAIADKQKAQLESEKQKIQNQKNIDKAKADATVKKTKAKAEADAKLIRAEADKKANELKKKSLTDSILKEEYINKWNGVMPKYVGDGDALISIDNK